MTRVVVGFEQMRCLCFYDTCPHFCFSVGFTLLGIYFFFIEPVWAVFSSFFLPYCLSDQWGLGPGSSCYSWFLLFPSGRSFCVLFNVWTMTI